MLLSIQKIKIFFQPSIKALGGHRQIADVFVGRNSWEVKNC